MNRAWGRVGILSSLVLLGTVGLQQIAPALVRGMASEPQEQKGLQRVSQPHRGTEAKHLPSTYAKGQLIVKYKDSVTECVHCLLAAGRPFQQATTDHSDSLDKLHAKYQVQSAQPIFRSKLEETRLDTSSQAKLKEYHQAKLQAVKTKFSKRTQRIPQGALLPDLSHVYLLQVTEQTEIQDTVAAFRQDPHVEYAQPNYRHQIQFVPNDPYYSSSGSWGQPYDDLWALKADKLNMEPAWDLTQGQGMVVGVIDTGLDYNHPDIAANVWTNPGEIPGNGLDDDENGYIDDSRGWDFVGPTYTNPMPDNDPMDGYGHGTHVSGTIAAVGNNGLGIIGVAPAAKLMPVKGLDNQGYGLSSDLSKAMVYAAENGADVLNNSWGCNGQCPNDPVAEEAVRSAYGLGAVVVFSAGNSSDDVAFYSPQNMTDPKPIVVAATDQLDQPTYFTNYGSFIDIAGPGGGTTEPPPDFEPFRSILSLKSSICDTLLCPSELLVGNGYLRQAGTSMAAPHASGLAALVLAYRSTFTNEEVRQVIRISADDIGSPGVDLYTGAGRLDATEALVVESVPEVRIVITNPASGSFFTTQDGPVTIMGTATGADFQSYQLFYGQGPSPIEWISLGEPIFTPVEDGILGAWTIENLVTEIYLLKLIASASNGVTFQLVLQAYVEDASIKRVTTVESSFERYPSISGDRIVWEDIGRNLFSSLYLYDLTEDVERQIVTGGVPGNSAISNDRIVYNLPSSPPCLSEDLHLYDLTTDTDWTIYECRGGYFDISGDNIVFVDEGYPNDYLYFCIFDPMTGACPPELIEQVSNPSNNYLYQPAVSGNRVVYTVNNELYLYDVSTGQKRQITSDGVNAYAPRIWGRRIVWFDTRSRTGNYDIYLYDLADETEQRIAENAASVGGVVPTSGLDIFGDWVVWESDRYGLNKNILLYDLSTGKEQPITVNPSDQFNAAISGNQLVWEDTRNKDWVIYRYEIPVGNGSPILEPIGDQPASEGQLLTLPVLAYDPNGDDLTLTVSSPLPPGASFETVTLEEPGAIEKEFRWTPDFNQAGNHVVTFTVNDGELENSETITITVSDVPLSLLSLNDNPDPFSPNGDGRKDTATISASFNHTASWTLNFRNAQGQPIRSFSGSGTSVSQIWDGRNQAGIRVADGIYIYTLNGTDVGASQASVSGTVRLDTVAPVLSGLSDSPDPFNPRAGQNTTISFVLSESSYVALRIYSASGILVRTLLNNSLKPAGSQSAIWDGKNGSGVLVPVGVYTYKVWVEDRAGNRASPYPATETVTVQ